jgi:L-lactate dehydrogenase complex protein LldG
VSTEELIAIFCANVAKSGAGALTVSSVDQLQQAVSELIGESSAVYCPGSTEKEKALTIPAEIAVSGYETAEVTVEEVPAAIAETGSVVCTSAGGRQVQAGLLPRHHVAIVSLENIFETLDQCFAQWHGSPPTNITLITGPSRTGDIEQTLSVGVHGPGRVDIIIYS